MVKDRTAATVMLALGALVLAACGEAGAGVDTRTATEGPETTSSHVTIGLTYVPNIQFAPWYVAEEAGYFDEEGVDVELRHHGQDEDLFGALGRGVEQVVVAGGDELLQARSQGVDVVDFATVYQDYPVRIIVPEDSPIRQLSDLRGATIGTPGRYGQTWFGLLAALEQAGLKEDDVTISEIGFTQQTALSTGHVDAVVGFINNDVPQFRATGLRVRALEQEPVPLVGIGMGAAHDLVDDAPAALAGITAAVRRATADIVADPQIAIDAARQQIPGTLTPEQEDVMRATLEATVPLYGDVGAEWGRPDPAAWEAMADFMEAQGLLAGPVSATEAVTDVAASNQ